MSGTHAAQGLLILRASSDPIWGERWRRCDTAGLEAEVEIPLVVSVSRIDPDPHDTIQGVPWYAGAALGSARDKLLRNATGGLKQPSAITAMTLQIKDKESQTCER
jgi:hypothetical protein